MKERCIVSGCTAPRGTKKLCPKHYQSLRSKGSVAISETEVLTMEVKPCSVEGCPEPAITQGMCGTHYSRWHRNGDPLLASPPDKPQKTTEDRFWEKVERTDGCWLWTGKTDEYGKGKFSFNGGLGSAHRYSYMKHYGVELESRKAVKQTCKVPSCVRPDHLRLAAG